MSTAAAPSILTVEDDPIVRADLRLILEGNGYAVCADARDGVEAVELARRHAPDLVLIDLNLPELDGVEATRRIVAERPVPVVALTGATSRERLGNALDAGAVGHVAKPFGEQRLLQVVHHALAGRGAETFGARLLVEQLVSEGAGEAAIEAAVADWFAN